MCFQETLTQAIRCIANNFHLTSKVKFEIAIMDKNISRLNYVILVIAISLN